MEVDLIYSVVYVPGVQHNASVIVVYMFILMLYSIIGYYKLLDIFPCVIQ